MTRILVALVAMVSLMGCAHHSLKAAETENTATERLAVLPVVPAQDPEAAIMLGILVGEVALRSGEAVEAARFYAVAALLSEDPRIAERATRLALFARDRETALQSSERWLQLVPESIEAMQMAAMLRIDVGQPSAAVELLDAIVARHVAGGVDPYPVVAALMAQSQQREAALETARLLTERRPDDVGIHRLYAEMVLRFASGEQALEAIQPARERFPESVSIRLLHARALHEAGHPEQSIAALQDTVEAHPEHREARLGYARALAEYTDREWAREQMDRLVERHPEDGQLLLALALMNLEAGQLDPAQEYLQRLDALDEYPQESAYYMGRLHEMKDDPEAARAAYARVETGDYVDEARLRSARVTWLLEGGEAARAAFAELQQDPNQDLARRAYLMEANEAHDQGEYEQARERLNHGLIQFPADARLLYMRGLVHEREDNIDAAEADFRAILEQDPNHVAALNALGYTLTDRTDRHEEALDLIERAYAMESDDAAIIDSYGWVLYRLGRLEEAEVHLRRAYSLSDDGEIASNLAVVLWERGERDEAREVLEAALQREPDHERLQRVRNDLLN